MPGLLCLTGPDHTRMFAGRHKVHVALPLFSVGAYQSQPLEVHADRSILICQFEYLYYI